MTVRRHLILLALPLLVMGVLAGCGDDSDTDVRSDDPGSTSAPADGELDLLDGRTFIATAVTEDGADRPLVDGSELRISFTDGQLGISAGCNSIGGPYVLDGATLRVDGGLSMTEMGCDAPLMDQDTWVADLFQGDVDVALAGFELTLTSGDTVIELTDREIAAPDVELTGTLWTLDTLISGDTASTVPGGAVATLEIAEDGSVSIDTGCNTGGGAAEVSEDSITFGPIATTRIACTEDGTAEVESAMLTVLDGEVAFEITETGLTITKGDRALGFSAP